MREAVQIQPFADNYFFCGPRTSQFEQVGNVFPPVLGFGTAISEGQPRDEAPREAYLPDFFIHCATTSDCKANMNVSIDSLSRSLTPLSARSLLPGPYLQTFGSAFYW